MPMTKDDYEREMMELYQKSLNQGKSDQFTATFCPSNWGDPCLLCDLSKEILFDKRTYDKTPAQEKARDLNRKNHYFSNVYFVANPTELITFDYGEKIFTKLLGYQVDPDSDHKNFFDPVTGKNILISKVHLGGDAKNVSYDVEARPNASKIIDKKILQQLSHELYNLDNIIENLKTKSIKVFPQYKLPMQKTEVRFLPSWLGPDVPLFYKHVRMHHNVSEAELAAILAGKLDPFKLLRTKPSAYFTTSVVQESAQPTTSTISPAPKFDWAKFGKDETAPEKPAPKKQAVPEPEEIPVEDEGPTPVFPSCYQKMYDPNNTECTEECAADGWAEGCKEHYERAKKEIDERAKARQAARRVTR